MKLIIGSHVSYTKDEGLAGSVKEALSYNSSTFMFYTGAPQNTFRADIDPKKIVEADKLMEENNIDKKNLVIHAPYIINLANDKDVEKWNFAINFLKQEILRANVLGVNKIVLHPGSHVGLGVEVGLDNICKALNIVLDESDGPIICLETMAGKGTELGKTLEEIKYIIDNVDNSNRLMVCLDTCHLNDAGYDMGDFDKFLDDFDRIIGLNKIGCIHINDSKNEKGAHKDRHENIGIGFIGFDNLSKIIHHKKLENIPKILETPYISIDGGKDRTYPPYKFEIDMIRADKFNDNLLNDIRNYYK